MHIRLQKSNAHVCVCVCTCADYIGCGGTLKKYNALKSRPRKNLFKLKNVIKSIDRDKSANTKKRLLSFNREDIDKQIILSKTFG